MPDLLAPFATGDIALASRIAAQRWHVGRISHVWLHPGGRRAP